MPEPQDDAVILEDEEPVSPSEGEETQDDEGTGEGDRGTASEDQVDWKARAQQFEANFKGLQSTVQKLVEEQRAREAKADEAEEKAVRARFEQELEGMTETEAKYARAAFETEMENRKLKAQLAQDRPVNDALARDAVLNKLCKDFGVSRKFLDEMVKKYNHPLAVAAAAEAAHATKKQLERPKPGKTESGSSGSLGGDEATLQRLTNSGNWEAYWELMDRRSSSRR